MKHFLLLFAALAASAQVTIQEIEVNQAIGKQFKGAMKFVAGKNTVVRAFLADNATIDGATSKVVVTREGATPFEMLPRSYGAPVNVVEFLCASREACGSWTAGKYTFAVTVNGTTKTTEGTEFNFQNRAKLRILARPVHARYGSELVKVSGDRWKKAVEFVRDTYPVSADLIQWDIKDEFDATDPKFDLETEPGRQQLWEGLTNLLPQVCATNKQADGCYDLIVGFIESRPMGYPNGVLQGWTYGAPTNLVVASDADMEATVAHEIAHIYGNGDTYDGGSLACKVNPAPDGFNGKDFDDSDKTTSCTEGKKTFPGASATLVTKDEARAYQVGGRGPLPDYACFMGSGGKASDYWVTPEVYNRLFDALDPANFAPKPSSIRQNTAPSRLLYFSAFINRRNEIQKEPWYSFSSTESAPNTTGDLMLRGLNAAGETVTSQKLTATFSVNSNPPVTIPWAPLRGVIRFPDTVTKFTITNKTETIYEIAVSATDPTVSAVTPSLSGTEVNGPVKLTWTGAQAENKPLFYFVEYNPNADKPESIWFPLAADLEVPEWNEDFSELPGGTQAKIRITATDGVRATTVDGPAFQVPFKAPFVYISDAPVDAPVKVGADVYLAGEAEDLQDDDIPEAQYVWTSSLQGEIGKGSELVIKNLRAGEHEITLTVTNKAGLNSKDTVKIRIQ
jgi:hypothetical protein